MAWGRESSLEAAGALGAAAPSLGSIGVRVGPGGGVVVIGTLLSDQIPDLLSSVHRCLGTPTFLPLEGVHTPLGYLGFQ